MRQARPLYSLKAGVVSLTGTKINANSTASLGTKASINHHPGGSLVVQTMSKRVDSDIKGWLYG